jgi:arylsulfatase A-like enzyme
VNAAVIYHASLQFFKRTAAALALLIGPIQAQEAQVRPNILWVTSEDNGPHLGCYGDEYATTPNLDRLSARSLRFARAWSNAPVCAPARTTLVTGVHAPSLGALNMRSKVRLPEGMRLFPQLLREAGYYCSNRSKEDYNFHKPGKVWDFSGGKGHWRQRAEGQPFFSVFNFTISHESRIRTRPHEAVHDPKKVPLPAYHPDTPEVRQDWAQYHDKISEMDAQVGGVLAQLEADGLADDTIVFYFSDHGSGMPRSKRWPYNSGLQVPMLVHFPERWAHLAPEGYEAGGVSDRLVSFVDLAPTVLSLAGLNIPDYMQGGAIAGEHATPAPAFMHGYRGRMDERYDLVRSVTDGRYIFIRNYMPHRIYGQYLDYMFQTPTTRIWKELYDQGKLQPPQTFFWETKPPLELYDLQSDPDEVRNLAHDSEYRHIRERLQDAQREQVMAIRDLGFLPECELHARAGESAPRTWGEDDERYDLGRILAMAERASSWNKNNDEPEADPHRKWMQDSLDDSDSAVRYWAALGVGILGPDPEHSKRAELGKLLDDSSNAVRIATAELLVQHGSPDEHQMAVKTLVECADMTRTGIWDAVLALGTLDALGLNDPAISEALGDLPLESSAIPDKFRGYVGRLIKRMTAGN